MKNFDEGKRKERGKKDEGKRKVLRKGKKVQMSKDARADGEGGSRGMFFFRGIFGIVVLYWWQIIGPFFQK